MTSKRKTKQLRWLVTGLMLAMTMVMPTSTWAEVMYTVFNTDTKKLTFKYGVKQEGTETKKVYDVPTDPKTDPGWLKNNTSITTVVFDESFRYARPTSCYKWFYNCSNLTSIDNIKNLYTEIVTDMSFMFWGCKKLTSLDVSKFLTSKVTDMSYMFYNCEGLRSLTLSNSFSTDKVTNMSNMFYNCKELTSLDLLSFNTAKVENMSDMFRGCSSLTSLDLSRFNTDNVTTMGCMFYDCSGLKSLKLSKFFKTDKVENMSNMFGYCSGLTSLDVSSFNTAKVTDMRGMFSGCQKLTSLNLSNFNTANVTYMSSMFDHCKELTDLDLSSFNTANVTTMGSMFWGCSGLTSLNLSNFDTANVTDMGSMFKDCSGLTSLTLSNFNTANVTDMSSMFDGCSRLTSLDLSNFDTAKVTDMNFMFSRCEGLTSLDLSSFNTDEVTNMKLMFQGCSDLTSLDLSSFNTAKVTDMGGMFINCSGLKTIYVSDGFTTSAVSNGSDMFNNCSQLVGATSYKSNYTGLPMANYNTGYFKTYYELGGNKVELFGKQMTTNSLNLNQTGDDDFVAHAPFKANTATYSRNLSTSKSTWFSLCLPFAYTPDNFTAYKLMSATANAVEIEEITTETIVAGTPVLFKFKDGVKKEINISAPDAQIVKAPVDGTAVNGPDGSLQLCGTYQTKTFSSDDNNAYILLNNKLMNPAKMLENKNVSKVSVKPFRAYMTLTASAQTSSARAFSIGHGGEEGTSAIDLLNSVATDDAEYYDINGRRIDAPVKGVNIVRRGNKTIKLIIK